MYNQTQPSMLLRKLLTTVLEKVKLNMKLSGRDTKNKVFLFTSDF